MFSSSGGRLPEAALRLLSSLRECRHPLHCAAHHAAVLKLPFFSLHLFNALIAAYSRHRRTSSALSLFLRLPSPDPVSFNSVISACTSASLLPLAFRFLRRLLRRFPPSPPSLTPLLSTLTGPSLLPAAEALHALALSRNLTLSLPVSNSLLTAYSNCGSPLSARRLFEEMPDRNVISWTALISGLARAAQAGPALALFRDMARSPSRPNEVTCSVALAACAGLRALETGRQVHGLTVKAGLEGDLCVGSSLMDLYSKCGLVGLAGRVLSSAEQADEVSFTVAIAGLAHSGMEEQALDLFAELRRAGLARIDPIMLAAVLGAVSGSGLVRLGPQVHSLGLKFGLSSNVFVGNGLVNSYFKCGFVDGAEKLFEEMPERNLVTWNAVIGGLARHGRGEAALGAYDRMREAEMAPNDVTFLSLLHACGHSGAVTKGVELAAEMTTRWGIEMREEHWACLVDMVGRAGLVEEAREVAGGAGGRPGALVWQALLGASTMRGDVFTGEYAAARLLGAKPGSPAAYVQMANIYSGEERWEERARAVKGMREVGAKKDPALSWLEVGPEVHVFVVGDRSHRDSDNIHGMLSSLASTMSDRHDDYVVWSNVT